MRYTPQICALLFIFSLTVGAQAIAQTSSAVTWGGKSIAIDMSSCSPENSNNGKNRAMAAINSASASSATIQFSTLTPTTGTYTTVATEEALGSGKVLLAAAGSAFGGAFLAKEGQAIKVTNTAGKYSAVFADLTVGDMESKAVSPKKLSANIYCQ